MKIYIVTAVDRHSDLGIRAYSDRDMALKIAKADAKEYAGHNDCEVTVSAWPGCIYHGVYSCEDDSMSVYVREVERPSTGGYVMPLATAQDIKKRFLDDTKA